MAQNGGQIKYGIGFDVDTSSLNKLKQSLSEIKKLTASEIQKINPGMEWGKVNKSLDNIRKSAVEVEVALERAFNKDLGTINVVKFRKELEKIKLNELHDNFSKAGAVGQSAFRSITTEILTTNMQLKQSHTLINKMAETMANTVKWGIASSVMNSFTGSVQKAYGYVKNLDSSLNDIRIVTGKSAEEMDKFAVKANKAAKELGQSTRNYTDASLIYYQQGLSEQDVQARAETTLKAANVTKQSGEAVSEQLTAVWNGYKVSAQEAELYVDKLAAVAASTATDLEELSVGMGKVASAAATMGVDIDQLNGHLATVISVTRQAPESVGTAFKTIYARMSDLKLGGTDEDGLGLGDVSGTMEAMGIQVLDQTGNLRDMGEVMEDVAAKWDTWTEAQKTAMAQVMAGKRQYNNLMALFENWDMYEEAVNTSANAMGTLQNQQDIYMESTEAHLQGLSTSMEDLYDSILDEGTINSVADSLAGLADLAGNFVDAIGGGQGILLNFGSIATKVFSRNIAEGIMTSVNNIKGLISNTQQLKAETELVAQFQDQLFGKNDKDLENLINKKKEVIELRDVMSETQQTQANDFIKTINELQNLKQGNEERAKETLTALSKISNTKELKIEDIVDKDGLKRIEDLTEQLEDFEKQINISEERIERFNEGLEETGKTNEELNDSLDENVKSLTELANKAGATGKETDALITKQAAYKAILKDSNATEEQRIKALEEYREAYRETVDILKRKHKEFQDATDPSKLSLGETLSKVEEDWDRFVKNLKTTQVIQAFVNVAASIGQIAGAMQSLGNIDNILTDDSLSGWEKFIQIISILSMSIPQLISGFGGIGKEILKLTTIWATHIIAQKKAQQEIEKHKRAVERNEKAIREHEKAIKENKEELEEHKRKLEDHKRKLEEHKKALEDETDALEKSNKKKSESGKLMSNLDTIAKRFGTTVKGLGIGLGALAAALAIISIGIGVFIAQWTKADREAKEAQKSLENVKKATESLRTEINETADSLDRYKELKDTFKDLETGTKEWKDALKESNDEVLKLLDNIPELAKYITNENGQLIISTEGQQYAENYVQQQGVKVDTFEWISEQNALEKQYKATLVNNRRKAYMDSGAESSMYSSYGNPQSSPSDWNGKLSDAQIFNKAVEIFAEEGKAALYDLEIVMERFGDISESQAKKVVENLDLIEKTANEKNTLETNILLRDELIAQKALEQSKQFGLLDSGSQSAIVSSAKSSMSKEADNLYETKYKDMPGGFTDAQVQEMLMTELGAEDFEDLLGNKFKLKINGQWTDEITDEMARQWLAEYETFNNTAIDSFVASRVRLLKRIPTKDESFQKSFLSFSGGAEGDLSSIKTEEELDEFQALMKNYLNDADAVALGFIDAEDALVKILEAINSRRAEIEEEIANINNNAKERLSERVYNARYQGKVDEAIENGVSDSMVANLERHYGERAKSFVEEAIGDIDFSKLNVSIDEVLEKIEDKTLLEATDLYNEGNKEAATKLVKEAISNGIKEAEVDKEKATELALTEEEVKGYAEKHELDYEEIEEYANHLQEIAEISDEVDDSLKDNRAAALDLAAANARLNKGLDTLADNGEDWIKTLKNGEKESLEYSKAMKGIEESLSDILNIDDLAPLGDTFVTDNLADIEAAANGSLDAVQRLREAAAQAIALELDLPQEEFTELSSALNDFIANTDFEDLEVGATLDDAPFIDVLNGLIESSNMTVEEAQRILDSLGFDPEIDYKEVPVDQVQFSHQTGTAEIIDADGKVKKVTVDNIHEHAENGMIKIPIIKGSKTTYRGAPKATASSPKRSSGGGKGGGGGGGGSDTPAKQEKLDSHKSEVDPYREINIELGKLSRNLEKLNKEQERLFGSDLSKNLEKQLEIIKKQVAATKEKIEIAKKERESLKKELEEKGIKFDGYEISDYYNTITAKDSEIKDMISNYNSKSGDWQQSEEGKEYKEQIDKKQKELSELLSSIEEYDTLIYETIPGLNDEITDKAYEEIDLQVAKFNIEAELRLDLTDAIKDWKDFEREVLNDLDENDFSGWAQSFVDEFKSITESGLTETLTGDLNDIMSSIQNMNSENPVADGLFVTYDGNGNLVMDETGAMEMLAEKQGELQENLIYLKELEDNINEKYLENIDAIEEAYDAQTENFEFINDQLEHSLNMIELIKGEEAYEEMGKVFEQQSQNYNALLKSQKEAVDYYRQMMETETDPEAKKKWVEMWKDATNELNETVEASIELLNEQYKNTINKTIKDMDEAFGGKGARAEWEIALKKDDNYLDGVNSLYEIQALENKINEGINNTDSLSAQKRLNKLKEEELTKLREKDKLTQYDVDRANQLYEIELKKIALEEAQQNKSKMRLRRDSSGNYSYQFVADEDAQAQAQQELDEAQNKLYNMDKEEFKSRQEEFYDTWEEYQDKMREYSELSYEERLAREDEFNEYFEYYQNRMVELSGNMNSIKQNLNQSTFDALSSLYEEDGRKFEELTDLEKSQLVDKLQPEFANTMAAMNTMLMGENGYAETWKMADDAINLANDTVKAGIEEIEDALGLESGGLSDTTSEYYTSATELAKDFITQQEIEIQNVIEEKDAVNGLRTEVQELKKDWQAVSDAANAALQASQNLREQRAKEEQERIAQEEAERNKQNNGSGDSGSSGGGSGSGDSSGSGSGGGNGKVEVGDTVVYESGVYTEDSYGNGNQGNQGRGGKVKVTYINKGVTRPYHISTLKGGDLGWVKKNQISGYDTGGYTGDWKTKSGKLAFLHEKELVLNKDDTANMLAMIKMVREIMGLGSQISTLDTSHEDKSTQDFQEKLNRLVNSVDNFKEKYLYEQKVDSLSLLQKFEELRQGLDKNEQMEELLRIEDYSSKYQEMLNEERKQEMEMLLNRLTEMEMKNEVFSNNRRKEIDVLERSISNSLTELKHIIKDSFKDKIDKVNPMFSNGGGGGGGKSAEDSKQNTIINIHADFPDVSNAKEIQLALDNLVNMASQRAYSTSVLRKK